MKKLLALTLALAMVLSFAACGGSSAPASSAAPAASTPAASTAPADSSAAPADSGEAEYVLKLGDVLAEDHPHSQSYYWFADRVAELTGGKVKVEVYVNSSLGNQSDLVEGLSLGTVQIAKSMTTGPVGLLP